MHELMATPLTQAPGARPDDCPTGLSSEGLHRWQPCPRFAVCSAVSAGLVISGPNREPAVGLRGHGHSGKQEHNWALPQAARDVRALLEQLDLHTATASDTCQVAAPAGFDARGGDVES
jgi:hypothetical protein